MAGIDHVLRSALVSYLYRDCFKDRVSRPNDGHEQEVCSTIARRIRNAGSASCILLLSMERSRLIAARGSPCGAIWPQSKTDCVAAEHLWPFVNNGYDFTLTFTQPGRPMPSPVPVKHERPPFRRLDPLESESAGRIARPTMEPTKIDKRGLADVIVIDHAEKPAVD